MYIYKYIYIYVYICTINDACTCLYPCIVCTHDHDKFACDVPYLWKKVRATYSETIPAWTICWTLCHRTRLLNESGSHQDGGKWWQCASNMDLSEGAPERWTSMDIDDLPGSPASRAAWRVRPAGARLEAPYFPDLSRDGVTASTILSHRLKILIR